MHSDRLVTSQKAVLLVVETNALVQMERVSLSRLTSSLLPSQLIKCLKKAFEPVLTDVRIDWYLPDNMEVLLSPSEIPPLYPGNHLIGYCTLYDVSPFKGKTSEVKVLYSLSFEL